MTLVIGHGNGHNEDSLVRFVRDSGCDSFGANEAERLIDRLRRLSGSRVVSAPPGFRDRRADDNPIITSAEWENLGELVVKVSDALPQFDRVAPDRVLTCSMYAHPTAERIGRKGIAHFNLHPDAAPEALRRSDAKHPLVVQYAKAMASAQMWMTCARAEGYAVVLTGDLQTDKENSRPWSPHRMLVEPLALDFYTVGIDWLLFDAALELRGLPHTQKLFDHTGFIATLKRRSTT